MSRATPRRGKNRRKSRVYRYKWAFWVCF